MTEALDFILSTREKFKRMCKTLLCTVGFSYMSDYAVCGFLGEICVHRQNYEQIHT